MRAKSWSRPNFVLRAWRTSRSRVFACTLPGSSRSRVAARWWAYRTRKASAARRTSLLPATGARNAVLGMGCLLAPEPAADVHPARRDVERHQLEPHVREVPAVEPLVHPRHHGQLADRPVRG